jgi:hypothetical protein
MWTIRISLDLYGDNFSPKRFLGQLPNSFIVWNSHEATDLKWTNKTETYEFGSLSILAPTKIGIPEELMEYENWYIDFIELHKDLMDKNGVTEINLFIDVFHSGGQCNWEIFSRDGLRKIGRHGIAIPISFYSLTDDQIIDLLRDAKYSEERIKDFVKLG